jgi:hypothetical protein
MTTGEADPRYCGRSIHGIPVRVPDFDDVAIPEGVPESYDPLAPTRNEKPCTCGYVHAGGTENCP